MLKFLKAHFLWLATACALALVDLRLFGVFALAVVLYKVHCFIEGLDRYLRVTGILEDVKLQAICRKLELSEPDFQAAYKEITQSCPAAALEAFERVAAELWATGLGASWFNRSRVEGLIQQQLRASRRTSGSVE